MRSTKGKFSRRKFLVTGAAVTAAGGVAAGVSYATRDLTPVPRTEAVEHNDVSLPKNGKSVLLVGGGLSGLITGCELIDRGFDVTILEKNATLGGRLRSWRDKKFGEASADPNWRGHPIEHGTHIVFNFYRNFRDVLARRGLSVRQRTINYPMPAISFAYPDGTFDDREASKAIAPFHMNLMMQNLARVSEASRKIDPQVGRKMMAFDPNNADEVAYLDSISMADWCRKVGYPEDIIRSALDPLMDMGNFETTEVTSALYYMRLMRSMLGYWKDAYAIQFFQDATDDTILQPLADHIRGRGGRIVFNSELDEYRAEGDRIVGVKTKALKDGQYICPICGEIHDTLPGSCRRCGWTGGGFKRSDAPAREYSADYYLLGVDIPNAKKILARSPFKERDLYPKVERLPASSVAVLYLWYPRAEKRSGGAEAQKTNWEDHFGGRECVMTADFPMLGTTLNLSMLKKSSFAEFNADVIETQIARTDRIQGMTDMEIAEAVDRDLRNLVPGLPKFTDIRMMRWDNFSCGTVGAEKLRPDMRTAFDNFMILGDWIALEHNCFLMEKVAVNAKRAVNYLLDDIGQKEGRMKIVETGTPNLTVDLLAKLFSVKA